MPDPPSRVSQLVAAAKRLASEAKEPEKEAPTQELDDVKTAPVVAIAREHPGLMPVIEVATKAKEKIDSPPSQATVDRLKPIVAPAAEAVNRLMAGAPIVNKRMAEAAQAAVDTPIPTSGTPMAPLTVPAIEAAEALKQRIAFAGSGYKPEGQTLLQQLSGLARGVNRFNLLSGIEGTPLSKRPK